MKKTSNKWLLIFVGIALVISVPILFKSKGVKHKAMTAIPTPVQSPTGDTTADTLATVQATSKSIEETNKKIIQQNDALRRDRATSLDDIQRIKQQQGGIDKTLRSLNAQSQQSHLTLQGMKNQLEEQRRLIKQMQSDTGPNSVAGIPIGFGFEPGEANSQILANGNWKTALDAESKAAEGEGFGLLRRGRASTKTSTTVLKEKTEEDTKSVLTIPNQLTGLDSVALTAMVGRIPVKGSIPDPYPFKLIMGKNNIAANGLDLPEVQGIIWSGVARGDWNLSCVGGDLYVATFIFQDGSIVTHQAQKGEEPLGWISDENGFPCVSGEFVTNAPQFLTQRAGLSALGVAAEAYSEAQRTTRSNLLETDSFVSGSTGKYVMGESVSAATQEISAWLLERQQQSFDAVVVLSGAKVGIHVTNELVIDYNTDARRLRYAQTNNANDSYLP